MGNVGDDNGFGWSEPRERFRCVFRFVVCLTR